MSVSDINSSKYIQLALEEYDRLGKTRFLLKYKFRQSRHLFLIHKGRKYDAKAVVGSAHQYVPGVAGPLKSAEFHSRQDAVPLLVELGFNVRDERAEPTEEVLVRTLETEYQRQIWLRKNVQIFAKPVRAYWNDRCAITGIESTPLLQACHIKQWILSDPEERLDPFNGICLASHIHDAWDAGLLRISPLGEVELSPELTRDDRERMRLGDNRKLAFDAKHRPYLKFRYDQH